MLPVPFSVLHLDGHSVWANAAYCDLVGMSYEAMMARRVLGAIHPDDHAAYERVLGIVQEGAVVEVELRLRHVTDRWLHVRWSLRHDPATQLVFAVALNVTDEHEAAAELRYDATHDPLTGAANRTRIREVLGELQHDGRSALVALVDLDGFKIVNDRMGHHVGDRLLVHVADRLRELAPDGAVVGRMGGDEFVVVLAGDDGTTARRALDAALSRINEVVVVQGRRVRVHAGIGIAGGTGVPPEELLRRADVAVYAAKSQGSGHVRHYDPVLQADDAAQRAMRTRLTRGLDEGLLQAFLQPIVRLEDGRPIGVEALARLVDPDVVAAGAFIGVAERMGVMGRVSSEVRDLALQAVVDLPDDVRLFLNVSGEDLVHASLSALLDRAEQLGVDPRRLVLELTEVTVLHDVVSAVVALQRARSRGAAIALDDFGIGTSSIGRLGRLPIDLLKLDRSLLVAARTPGPARELLGVVAQIGPALGMQVILEGIETDDDLQLARDLRVDAGQGWLLGEPAPTAEVVEVLRAASSNPTSR